MVDAAVVENAAAGDAMRLDVEAGDDDLEDEDGDDSDVVQVE